MPLVAHIYIWAMDYSDSQWLLQCGLVITRSIITRYYILHGNFPRPFITILNSQNTHHIAPKGELLCVYCEYWLYYCEYWPISQIPQCICSISHNTPYRTEMWTLLIWMVHCGIWNMCIMGLWIWSTGRIVTRPQCVLSNPPKLGGKPGERYQIGSDGLVKRRIRNYVIPAITTGHFNEPRHSLSVVQQFLILYTEHFRYLALIICQSTPERHPRARPLGRAMGCPLGVQSLILLLAYSIQHRVNLDRGISRLCRLL